ncbi:MAG: maleylpyruvate isomerase N-terminal domain-containing protein [Actinomycetota bacterium]|nr:maleylpyruvate isomerase N-terminal domain-containing protein [Actinomycetota bacterium]
MIIERDVDCGALYERKRCELMALGRALTEAQLHEVVAATPAWSIRDVMSHLVGITADLNALRFGEGDADAWSAEQVRTRRGKSIDELGDEWDTEAPRFEDGLRLLGYEIGSHYVGDLVQHMADIDHALGQSRIPDADEALAVALDFYVDAFHEALVGAKVGSVIVRVADEEWVVGGGPAVATLTATRFEAFRCFGGRRSEQQIRALDWTGDLDAVLGSVSAYPLPQNDIDEG